MIYLIYYHTFEVPGPNMIGECEARELPKYEIYVVEYNAFTVPGPYINDRICGPGPIHVWHITLIEFTSTDAKSRINGSGASTKLLILFYIIHFEVPGRTQVLQRHDVFCVISYYCKA